MAVSVHVASCSFLRLSCRSDHELFAPSYVRSNKKRSSKLLRCFPHCCPDHAPRSYCGCSLHVLVTFESAGDAAAADRNEDFVVCARFESTATGASSRAGDIVSAMQRDDIVALPSSVLLPPGDSESDWVRAEKAGDSYQQEFPKNTILYVLNNHRSPQWYYGYDSGSTKTQREMKHVLAVYALVLHPLSERRTLLPLTRLASVVARQSSPSFTMVSYRRQSNVRRRERENARDPPDVTRDLDEISQDNESGAAGDGELSEQSMPQTSELPDRAGSAMAHSLMSMDPSRATSHLQVDVECDGSQAESRTVDELGVADEENPFSSAPPPGLEPPRQTLRCHFCQGPLVEPPHARHDTLERLQMMLIVRFFLRYTPLGDFSFHFNEMDSRIRRNMLASLSPFGQLRQGAEPLARELLANIRSSFSLACFSSRPSHSDVSNSKNVSGREQTVLRSCADLLLDAFSSIRVQQILASIGAIQVDTEEQACTDSESCEQFGQLIADIFDEFTHLLADRCSNRNSRFATYSCDGINYCHANIPHLVDDILSLVYADPKYQPLRTTASALLLGKDDAMEIAAHELFRAFELQQQQVCNSLPDLSPQFDSFYGRRSSAAPADLARTQPGFEHEKDDHNSLSTSNEKWTRRWFLEPTSIRITPLSPQMDEDYGNDGFSASDPSLLSVLGMIHDFASIDIFLENLQLSVGSSMKGTDQERTVFALDGHAHPFKILPNGVVVAAGVALFGDRWGLNEYQGRISDDRLSMDLLLTVLPLQDSGNTDKPWSVQRVHVRVALDDERDGEESFSMFAQFATVRDTPPPHHSWPPNAQSDIEVKLSRTPTLKVHAVFVGAA
ncbi:hypothetical protein PR003_g10059 [Phytophthora rubi]|uniref:Uncharacterized protein n=1 Tax=Phytophthora rubi TaxID=129364 RepID=A0A6A4FSD5_9STRA|nr:hypothetical protein PR001_g26560 [Phytophthora rubi]KAE9015098.1 hypothetical protein PR002_g14025 [Phytophthora rubi]KAE9341303.1 hypothetical protein PR003_g10059 [Phytophthora rubi]